VALISISGLDVFDDRADAIAAGWTVQNTTNTTFSTSNGRFGGGAWNNTSATTYFLLNSPNPTTQGNNAFVSFAYWHNGAGGATDGLVQLSNISSQSLMTIRHNAAGQVLAYNSPGSLVGSSAGTPLTPNTWHWISIRTLLGTNNSTGELQVYVDGVEAIATIAAIDTYRGAGDTAAQWYFFGSDGDSRFDDIILSDDSGSTNNTFIPDARVFSLNVDGAGGTDDWTPNTGTGAAAVDDALAGSDGDTTYISSATVAQESRYAIESLPITPTGVLGVNIKGKCRKDDAGSRTIRGVFNVNAGSSEQLGNTIGLSDSYAWYNLGLRDTNLAGSAWTNTNITDLEIGVEVVT